MKEELGKFAEIRRTNWISRGQENPIIGSIGSNFGSKSKNPAWMTELLKTGGCQVIAPAYAVQIHEMVERGAAIKLTEDIINC